MLIYSETILHRSLYVDTHSLKSLPCFNGKGFQIIVLRENLAKVMHVIDAILRRAKFSLTSIFNLYENRKINSRKWNVRSTQMKTYTMDSELTDRN